MVDCMCCPSEYIHAGRRTAMPNADTVNSPRLVFFSILTKNCRLLQSRPCQPIPVPPRLAVPAGSGNCLLFQLGSVCWLMGDGGLFPPMNTASATEPCCRINHATAKASHPLPVGGRKSPSDAEPTSGGPRFHTASLFANNLQFITPNTLVLGTPTHARHLG